MLNDVQRAYNRGWNDAIDRVNAILREFAELAGKWDGDRGDDDHAGRVAPLARENGRSDADRQVTGK